MGATSHQDPAVAVLQEQFTGIREDIGKIEASMSKMSDAMTQLVRVESIQVDQGRAIERAFLEIGRTNAAATTLTTVLDNRLKDIEKDMPGLREVRGWMIAVVLSLACTVGWGVVTDRVSATPRVQSSGN